MARASNTRPARAAPRKPGGSHPLWLHSLPPQIRLAVALVAGLAAGLLAPLSQTIPKILIGWDAGSLVYLALAFAMMVTAETDGIKRQADIEERSRSVVLTIIVLAAVVMLVAIVAQLSALSESHAAYRYAKFALVIVTIVVSWVLVHLVFGLFYAHEYHSSRHRDGAAGGAGLKFPGDETPDYFDFLYFAFVIGMTAQTSDVEITSRRLRRIATMQGLLAFFFNTAVIALVVNLTAQIAG